MTILLIEGFDHYNTLATMNAKGWTSWNGGTPTSFQTGRFSGQCMRHTSFQNGMYKPLGSTYTTLYAGLALRYANISNGSVFSFYTSATSTNRLGQISNTDYWAFFNASSTQLGPSFRMPVNTWNYVEVRIVISATVGELEVRLNGQVVVNSTSLNTGSSAIDAVFVGSLGNSSAGDFDDMYVSDSGFLGDIVVQTLYPNGNGNSSQLTGSDGNSTDNYLLVDETVPPSTADYVESSTVGHKDTYTYTDLTVTSGTVHAVQIVPYAAKTDAGSRSIVSVARLSGTETDSSDKVLPSTVTYLPDIRETKPGGGAWSISDVNSAEFGVKVTA
jgi:hypothetical protein